MERFSEGLKKVMLAGLGAVATTTEKSQELIDNLAKKGEEAANQGKFITPETRQNIKNKVEDVKEGAKSLVSENADRRALAEMLRDLSGEQIARVRDVVEKIKAEDAFQKAAGLAGEAMEKAGEVAEEAMEKAGEAMEKAGEVAGEAAEKAKKFAGEAAEKASEAAEKVKDAVARDEEKSDEGAGESED